MIGIIPKPNTIIKQNGCFLLGDECKISLLPKSEQLKKTVDLFINSVAALTGINLKYNELSEHSIIIKLISSVQGREGYILNISKKKIELLAEAEIGIFYGLQTLLQLMLAESPGNSESKQPFAIPCCELIDKPRFKWRGMHLDVSRHFFSVPFIKKYLDLLAFHKLNIFHWHLTDDNGWRIEIKKYPELTNTGAWRKNLEHLPWNERDNSGEPGNGIYGGFYSQEEIRDIVNYAEERFITVVPEIEMPGHTREVFAAYPQFSCTEKKLTVAPGGYWPNIDIFCAGKDETFDFLKNILSEVIELFPSPYIHIGGDEADKTRWKECPLCQKRIRAENLKDEQELQSWFIRQIAHFLHSQNKKLIGWDEIAEGGLLENSTVMCWRGDGKEAAKTAIENRCEVVMCPNPYLYFDWKQNADDQGAFGVTTLEKVYNFTPVPDEFSREEAKFIIGAQGNVWTEWMPTEEIVEYMALPRMSALAELVWTCPENKNYTDFIKRLPQILKFFSLREINFNSHF